MIYLHLMRIAKCRYSDIRHRIHYYIQFYLEALGIDQSTLVSHLPAPDLTPFNQT